MIPTRILRRLATTPLAAASLLALFFSSPTFATGLVLFPFNNSADGQNGLGYSTFDSTVLTSATVTQGSGLGMFSVGTDSWSGSTEVLKTGPGTDIVGATAADALSNNWFFNINLTPVTTMDIGTISVDWSRGGPTRVRGWFVRSSLDNYVTDLYSNETPSGTATGLQNAIINLSGFTGIGATDFRFYIYTSTTARYMDFQNIQFNTPTAVPEPPAYALVLLGLTCIGLSMRRRRWQVSVRRTHLPRT